MIGVGVALHASVPLQDHVDMIDVKLLPGQGRHVKEYSVAYECRWAVIHDHLVRLFGPRRLACRSHQTLAQIGHGLCVSTAPHAQYPMHYLVRMPCSPEMP